jgi:peptidoglycan/xylan/chitin deacetylase (PgdA/CDA1 family)
VTGRRLTLTFDNGPTAGVTEGVLDALAAHCAPATFFTVGNDLRRAGSRALLERAVAEGHWVGNHTMTHTQQFGLNPDPDLPEREIGATQRELGDLARPERLFRPFGGGGILGRNVLSPAAVRFLEDGGYTCVLWNSVPRDWEQPDGWIANCLADVEANEWTLVVLHDTATGAMRHLPAFLGELERAGVAVTQEFPPDCVPIRRGEVTAPIDHLLPSTEED